MIIAKVQVSGVKAQTIYCKDIPAGIIGAQVEFEYLDPMWDTLSKTVVFKGFGTKDVLNAGSIVTIPAEVVSRSRVQFKVGIYGTDAAGNIAIPTLWANLAIVKDAADPSGDTSTDPSLPVWAQLESRVENLEQQGGGSGGGGAGGITELPIATDEILGGIKVGENLNVTKDGTLSVKTTGAVEETDLRPITSQAVYSEFEKIVALLNTI